MNKPLLLIVEDDDLQYEVYEDALSDFELKRVTTGRDAMMAWNVTSGKWQGVDLTGVRVMAIVSSDANLSEDNAARQSEIIVDSSASRAQALAMLNALKEKYAASLGNVVEVRSAPIKFERSGRTYAVVTNEAAKIGRAHV